MKQAISKSGRRQTKRLRSTKWFSRTRAEKNRMTQTASNAAAGATNTPKISTSRMGNMVDDSSQVWTCVGGLRGEQAPAGQDEIDSRSARARGVDFSLKLLKSIVHFCSPHKPLATAGEGLSLGHAKVTPHSAKQFFHSCRSGFWGADHHENER